MVKANIMIVEDEAIVAKEIENSLQDMGYAVTSVVSSGKQAIEKAEQDCPDLILMDVQLPGIDGYEVTRRLKGKDATRDIPVIVVTSLAMKGEEARAKEVGAAGYISKPIDIHKLMDTVAEHLPGKDEQY